MSIYDLIRLDQRIPAILFLMIAIGNWDDTSVNVVIGALPRSRQGRLIFSDDCIMGTNNTHARKISLYPDKKALSTLLSTRQTIPTIPFDYGQYGMIKRWKHLDIPCGSKATSFLKCVPCLSPIFSIPPNATKTSTNMSAVVLASAFSQE